MRRIPDGRPAACDLTTILNDLAGPIETQLPEGIGFALRAEAGLWAEVWGPDLARFIWEILGRVIAALPEEVGVATVDASALTLGESDASRLGLSRAGPYVCLEIAHTADQLDLGDFLLQARMMRGRLDCEATPKVGGSVRILLPAPRR